MHSRTKPKLLNAAGIRLGCILVSFSHQLLAQPIQIARVGEWARVPPGVTVGIAVSGNYAYLGNAYGGLHVVDISTLSNPVRVASLESLSAGDVMVSGNYAYVASGRAIEVIDINHPHTPVPVGRAEMPDFVWSITVSSNYAFAAGSPGLQILDIGNASSPTIISEIMEYASDVAVCGTYGYVIGCDGVSCGLWVIDLSNPANPTIRGAAEIYGAEAVAVAGNYAYVAQGDTFDFTGGLLVFDISDPGNPRETGGFTNRTGGYARDVAVSGNYAYLARSEGLHVIDISDPSNPVIVASNNIPAWTVTISGTDAYLAAGSAGLQVFDVSTPSAPIQVDGFGPKGRAHGVAVSGEYALLADGPAGLHVLDLTNRARPVRLGGYFRTNLYARDVGVSGNYAYLLERYSDLHVIDFINPTNPVLVASASIPQGGDRQLVVSGNYAYVLYEQSGYLGVRLRIIDISNPTNPVATALYAKAPVLARPFAEITDVFIGGLALSGSYAYITYWGYEEDFEFGTTYRYGAWERIDISNPTNPMRVASCPIYEHVGEVAASGGNAYTTYLYQGGGLFGLNCPSMRVFTNGAAYALATSGNYLYVGGGEPNLRVLSLSNPTNLTVVGSLDFAGGPWDLAVDGNYVYIASDEWGLQILWAGPPQEARLSADKVGNQMQLRWPVGVGDYLLERTAGLSVPQWQTINAMPQVQDESYWLNLPTTNPASFFRLRRP